ILFTIHNVTDESHFKKYLQLSLSDLPEFEKTYAHTHITSNTSLSWSRVKVLFAQRFESHDHINQLKRQYRALKYTHDDNIQSFSHRFINICGELNYDVDSPIVIDNFMSLLPSDIHRRFLMQCHGRQKSLSDFESLQDIVADITAMENAHNNAQYTSSSLDNHNNNNNNNNNRNNHNNNRSSKTVSFHGSKTIYPSSSSSSSASPAKFCKNHPTSTGHTTAECRMNAFHKSL